MTRIINKKVAGIISMVLLTSLYTSTVLAQQSGAANKLIKIPFGKNNYILYSLNEGTYAVVFNGRHTIHDAVAVYKGEKEIKNTVLGERSYTITEHKDAWGKGHRCVVEQKGNAIRLQQIFYVYPDKPFFFAQVKVYGKEVAANYVAPLVTDRLTMEGQGDKRALFAPFDNDMWARFDAQPLDKANFTGSEVTALYNNSTRLGLIIGSVEHAVWKTGIKVQYTDNNQLSLAAYGGLADSVITHDNIPHGKVSSNGILCSSPKIMVGMFDDWRTGMEEYATANTLAEPRRIFKWNKATPMGWNSWGVIQNHLTIDKAKRVVDFFADSCRQFRNQDNTLYIDLDSYWDNLVKGGLKGDVSQLKEFVQYCRSKQLVPGIYWGPFADWGKYDRKIEGSTFSYPASWITQKGVPTEVDGARAMDPTYPGTQDRIVYYINTFKELGFEMIKIDFLGHGAMESDHFYDPAVTTGMQAYKVGMEFLDSVLDGKMLTYAAISPTMATGRYVHMRRIACDAFSAIDNTEYTLNSTGYGWWQDKLYHYVDADHIVFNKEKPGANRARLASALVTGTLITGDDFSAMGEWSNTAKQLLQNKELLNIIKDGRSFRPVDANSGKRAPELFTRTINGITYLAVFNYDQSVRTYTISSERLGLKKGAKLKLQELFTQASSTATGQLSLTIPPSDAAIYKIAQ
ncbi:MAG: alpha-galactosidase [Niastella sp.]|nr:alpha-galactosidase [Niastella sp.]